MFAMWCECLVNQDQKETAMFISLTGCAPSLHSSLKSLVSKMRGCCCWEVSVEATKQLVWGCLCLKILSLSAFKRVTEVLDRVLQASDSTRSCVPLPDIPEKGTGQNPSPPLKGDKSRETARSQDIPKKWNFNECRSTPAKTIWVRKRLYGEWGEPKIFSKEILEFF